MMAMTLRCGCGATFHALAADELGGRMEAWAIGWEYEGFTDGTAIDTCPGCVGADDAPLVRVA